MPDRRRAAPLALLLIGTLGSCSYSFRVIAFMQDGTLFFAEDPGKASGVRCVSGVTIQAVDGARAIAGSGDSGARIAEGVFWEEKGSCEDNRLPLPYAPLKGRSQPRAPSVALKPLVPGVRYRIMMQGPSGGYGSGCFLLRASGGVENLSRCEPAKDAVPAPRAAVKR